jgi:hypothetical protein
MTLKSFLFACIALLAVYILWQGWRLYRLSRRSSTASAPKKRKPGQGPKEPSAGRTAAESLPPSDPSAKAGGSLPETGKAKKTLVSREEEDELGLEFDKAADIPAEEDETTYDFLKRKPSPPPEETQENRANAAAQAAQTIFQLELQVQQLRRDLEAARSTLQSRQESLQVELDALGNTLRGEITRLSERMEIRNQEMAIAPQYGEAMVFAKRGFDAEEIARQCHISLGEAELVLSMVRRDQGL